MKYLKTLALALAVSTLFGCTLDPVVDLAIQSVEPTHLTVSEAGQSVTVTIEVRNGIDVGLNSYEIKYYSLARSIEIDHRADLTSHIGGGSYDDGSWETATGTVGVVITYTDLIDYAQDNDIEQMTAEIYIHGRDANGNDFKIGKAYVTLYF